MKRILHNRRHPRAALTVDCVVLGFDGGELKVLLIQRGLEPFKGRWALPGGFVRMEETLGAAARRELAEEAGLENIFLEQLYTFGTVDRDPRERVVSVAHYALVKLSDYQARAATDAASASACGVGLACGVGYGAPTCSTGQGAPPTPQAEWFPISRLPRLAFDHAAIVAAALARLQGKVRYQPIGFELLPPKFTLSELQHLYEAILETRLDKRNFRKKALSLGLLAPLQETLMTGRHRPAQLFRFDAEKYKRLKQRGFNFEL